MWYMVWGGMVWCMVWYKVWYGMVWYGMVWYGMVWCTRWDRMRWDGMEMVWYGRIKIFRKGGTHFPPQWLKSIRGGWNLLSIHIYIYILFELLSYVNCLYRTRYVTVLYIVQKTPPGRPSSDNDIKNHHHLLLTIYQTPINHTSNITAEYTCWYLADSYGLHP